METSVLCEHCQTSFSSQSNLRLHLRTAKYCKQLRQSDNQDSVNECDYCKKTYSTPNYLQDHMRRCGEKRKYEEDTHQLRVKEMYETKLREKDIEIAYLKEQLGKCEEKLEKCEEKLEKRIDDITDIARQTKTKTNHNNNIIINANTTLDLRDTKHINQILEQHLDGNVLVQGQRGLARMITERLLTDENGNRRYRCTDRSRDQFEYTDPNGHVERDANGNKLRDALVESNLKEVAMAHGEEMWKRKDGSIDYERFGVLNDKVLEVANLHSDDTKFRRELSTILS